MKIRNGFVSNSSSSSFMVMFPRKPKTQAELKNVLFGKGYTGEEFWEFDVKISDIVQYIFTCIFGSNTATPKKIKNIFDEIITKIAGRHISIEYIREAYPIIIGSDYDKLFNTFSLSDDAIKKCVDEDYKYFKRDYKGHYVFIKEFSDDDKIESAIESGKVFRKLPHVRLNHH